MKTVLGLHLVSSQISPFSYCTKIAGTSLVHFHSISTKISLQYHRHSYVIKSFIFILRAYFLRQNIKEFYFGFLSKTKVIWGSSGSTWALNWSLASFQEVWLPARCLLSSRLGWTKAPLLAFSRESSLIIVNDMLCYDTLLKLCSMMTSSAISTKQYLQTYEKWIEWLILSRNVRMREEPTP